MAAYRAVLTKEGELIPFPNPERFWDGSAHNDWTNYLVSKGIPRNDVEALWEHMRSGKSATVAPNGLRYFSSKKLAEEYSGSIKKNAVLEEENKIGINRNAVTPAEKLQNYEKAIDAYSDNIKNGRLGEIQKNTYNKYKNASIVSDPKNFTDAVNNYFVEFSEAKLRGVENISSKQKDKLSTYSKQLKDYYSKDLSPESAKLVQYVDDVQSAINSVNNQKQLVKTQEARVKSLGGKEQENARARLAIEEDALSRLINTANQQAPEVVNALSKAVPSNIANIVAKTDARVGQVTSGLSALSGDRIFGTGDIAFKLNSQVTDQQIIDDINKARVGEYKKLYELGQATTVDLQSRIKQAEGMLPSLTGQQKATATKQIGDLKTELSQVTKDTLQAENLYKNYTGISGTQASTAVSKFRESLRLPEERTIDQINEIDPTVGATVRALSKQYQTMAETPLGATTNPETEAFRRDVEQTIAGQVALGSQLGAEEQRQYQQAARAAQTARGNIFGVAPAVEEAVTTGVAGEQRLQARLGAAQGFLASGQSMSDAAARDVGLRNALEQSRLGAAQGFIASGPTMYNMASQRLGTQQAMLNNYLAASAPRTTGTFQGTPSAATPFAYVNPNAGFLGAQTTANIYGDLVNSQAQMHGAQVGAISRQSSGAEQFGQIATGLSNLIKI